MTAGSVATLPSKKSRLRGGATIDSTHVHPSASALPRPFQLRRCTSVEVLTEEPNEGGMQEEEDTTPLHTLHLQPPYSRNLSLDSVNLNTSPTPNTSMIQNGSIPMNCLTPGSLLEGGGLFSIHEDSRLVSRRSSTSSVVIIPSYKPRHDQREDSTDWHDGFEVVNPEPAEGEGEGGEGTSGGGGGGGGARPPVSKKPKVSKERRRSSVTELVSPMTLIVMHAFVVGCLYLSRQ